MAKQKNSETSAISVKKSRLRRAALTLCKQTTYKLIRINPGNPWLRKVRFILTYNYYLVKFQLAESGAWRSCTAVQAFRDSSPKRAKGRQNRTSNAQHRTLNIEQLKTGSPVAEPMGRVPPRLQSRVSSSRGQAGTCATLRED